MHVEFTDFVAGAQSARGLAIIIDVFRAFSVAAHAFARGVHAIVPVGSIEAARMLKQQHPDWLLIGERHARPLPGFDCGNSPTHLESFDVRGLTLIHTTHAGTQGVVNAARADEVITGTLVNAAAIVRYARARRFDCVTLVRMGKQAQERCDEDDLCAELLAARLRGEYFDTSGIRARLRLAPAARKFFDPACDWAPERDFELCTQVDAYDFILRLGRQNTPASLQRIEA